MFGIMFGILGMYLGLKFKDKGGEGNYILCFLNFIMGGVLFLATLIKLLGMESI